MRKDRDVAIVLDMDGVFRHNNKSLGTGDIPKEWRTKETLLALHKKGRLPKGYYNTTIEEIEFIPGTLGAIKRLTDAGFDLYVISNQEAIGVGAMTMERWENIKDYMNGKIEMAGGHIVDWFVCPHFPDEGCACRKPKPGLYYLLSIKHGVILPLCISVGDTPSDMEAAARAGCKFKVHIRLSTADEEFQQSEYADAVVANLGEAVDLILKRELVECCDGS
jgi:D-glycero-D-manno-heptose 1,7-bisphosphate phosphatase